MPTLQIDESMTPKPPVIKQSQVPCRRSPWGKLLLFAGQNLNWFGSLGRSNRLRELCGHPRRHNRPCWQRAAQLAVGRTYAVRPRFGFVRRGF